MAPEPLARGKVCQAMITSLSIGITTNIKVELQAINNGMLLAWNNDYNYVICESDLQTALKLNEEGVRPTHHLLSVRVSPSLSPPTLLPPFSLLLAQTPITRKANFCDQNCGRK